jgi:hypothetical protein
MQSLMRVGIGVVAVAVLSVMLGAALEPAGQDAVQVMTGPMTVIGTDDGRMAGVAVGASFPTDTVKVLFILQAEQGVLLGVPQLRGAFVRAWVSATRLTLEANGQTIVLVLQGRDTGPVDPTAIVYPVFGMARYDAPGLLETVTNRLRGDKRNPFEPDSAGIRGVEGDPCQAGGPGSTSCSIEGCDGEPSQCSVTCGGGHYACCFCWGPNGAYCLCPPIPTRQ